MTATIAAVVGHVRAAAAIRRRSYFNEHILLGGAFRGS
jgi:hypothetical protein